MNMTLVADIQNNDIQGQENQIGIPQSDHLREIEFPQEKFAPKSKKCNVQTATSETVPLNNIPL